MDEGGPPGREADAMLYDWFKHLTSLSLLALGGVLSLSQISDGKEIKTSSLTMVLIFLSLAGIMAFSAADQVVRSRVRGESLTKQVRWMQVTTPAVLGLGLGSFLYVFVKAIN